MSIAIFGKSCHGRRCVFDFSRTHRSPYLCEILLDVPQPAVVTMQGATATHVPAREQPEEGRKTECTLVTDSESVSLSVPFSKGQPEHHNPDLNGCCLPFSKRNAPNVAVGAADRAVRYLPRSIYTCNASEIHTGWSPRSQHSFER